VCHRLHSPYRFCGIGRGKKIGSLFGLGPVGYIVDLWDLHITFCVSDGEPIVIAHFIVQSGVSFFSLHFILFLFYFQISPNLLNPHEFEGVIE